MLVAVAYAGSEPEAELIGARLAQADIPSVSKGVDLAQLGISGACEVYVEDHLADRAREVLAAQPVSDEELARLSDEAGRELHADPTAAELPKALKRFLRELPGYGFAQTLDTTEAGGRRLIVFRRAPMELRVIGERGRWSADLLGDGWPDGDRVPVPLAGLP